MGLAFSTDPPGRSFCLSYIPSPLLARIRGVLQWFVKLDFTPLGLGVSTHRSTCRLSRLGIWLHPSVGLIRSTSLLIVFAYHTRPQRRRIDRDARPVPRPGGIGGRNPSTTGIAGLRSCSKAHGFEVMRRLRVPLRKRRLRRRGRRVVAGGAATDSHPMASRARLAPKPESGHWRP
jgi:hypothetical protein